LLERSFPEQSWKPFRSIIQFLYSPDRHAGWDVLDPRPMISEIGLITEQRQKEKMNSRQTKFYLQAFNSGQEAPAIFLAGRSNTVFAEYKGYIYCV
jgi:hypothetical protein